MSTPTTTTSALNPVLSNHAIATHASGPCAGCMQAVGSRGVEAHATYEFKENEYGVMTRTTKMYCETCCPSCKPKSVKV
jgi:hypothetical protein